MRDAGNKVGVSVLAWSLKNSVMPLGAVSNGLIQFESAHKIWPLLKLLVIKRWELACSCLKNFCNFACSYAWIFVKILCCVAKASFASWKQKLTLVQCFHSGKTGKHALYPLYLMFLKTCFLVLLLFYWNWLTRVWSQVGTNVGYLGPSRVHKSSTRLGLLCPSLPPQDPTCTCSRASENFYRPLTHVKLSDIIWLQTASTKA